jgi:hypothetical protein
MSVDKSAALLATEACIPFYIEHLFRVLIYARPPPVARYQYPLTIPSAYDLEFFSQCLLITKFLYMCMLYPPVHGRRERFCANSEV